MNLNFLRSFDDCIGFSYFKQGNRTVAGGTTNGDRQPPFPTSRIWKHFGTNFYSAKERSTLELKIGSTRMAATRDGRTTMYSP